MGFIVPDTDPSLLSPADDAEWQPSGRRGQLVGCVGRPGSWLVASGRMFPSVKELLQIVFTFFLVIIINFCPVSKIAKINTG